MAATILLVTLIAGLSAVAIVYMQHNLKCAQLVATNQVKIQNIWKKCRSVIVEC